MNVAAILVLLCSTGGLFDPHPRLVAAQNPQLVYDSAMSLFFAWAEKQGGSNPKPIQRTTKARDEAGSIIVQLSAAATQLNSESLRESLSAEAELLYDARLWVQTTALEAARSHLMIVTSVFTVRDTTGVRQAAKIAYSLARTCHEELPKIAGTPKPAADYIPSLPGREEFSSYQEAMRAFYTWATNHGGRTPKPAAYRSGTDLASNLMSQRMDLGQEMIRLWETTDLYADSSLKAKHDLMLVALDSAVGYVELLSMTLPVWDTAGAREAASLAYSLWATAHDEQKKIP